MLELKLKKGAVTGGLSCGKSSVCRFFKEIGAYVVSADQIVHELLTPDTNLGQKVIELLGQDILENKKINRSIIASKVFHQPSLLKSLETIVHPVVFEEIEKKYQEAKNKGNYKLFIAEIPLLFEARKENLFDFTIAVVADSKICQSRFLKSTGNSLDEYLIRTENQLSPDEKARRSNFVIVNNGSLDEMREAVEKIYNNLNTVTNQ